MISFLFVISATFIGIFLYVMTLQNKFIWHIKGSIYEWLFSERSYFTNAHISIIWYGIWLFTVNRRYRQHFYLMQHLRQTRCTNIARICNCVNDCLLY